MKQRVAGESYAGALPVMTDEETALAAALRRHVQVIGGDIGDRNVWKYDELNETVAYVTRELRGAGYVVTEQPYQAGGRTVKNLEAVLDGAGAAAAEVLVVGAHYDSVRGCPGANDNGTGVAAVLEMARAMAEDRPARTVRFVLFVNEEPPFFHTDAMGSLVYARACKARGDRVVGMISMETIGFYSDEPGSQRYPPPFDVMFPDTGNFIGFVADERSGPFLKQVMASFRAHTQFPSEGVAAPAAVEGVGWSDHWSFWQQGYPGLMVTDTAPFRYRHYHHPTDTPDKVDYDRAARVVAGMIRVTRELAGVEAQ
jgi:Zn-dependent M28 family amino/carboxypeptidase